MTWSDFYLLCFLVGFLLSLTSFLLGNLHLHVHLHHGMPHLHAGGHGHGGRGQISIFNFGTVAAFLAWFGGAGFLLSNYTALVFTAALLAASATGLTGAWLIFRFLKMLAARDQSLDPADYDMIGVLGTVSSTVHQNGVGEILFSQAGMRRACAVRSEDGARIDKGAEVVVTRYADGIAYVRRWEEFTKEAGEAAG